MLNGFIWRRALAHPAHSSGETCSHLAFSPGFSALDGDACSARILVLSFHHIVDVCSAFPA